MQPDDVHQSVYKLKKKNTQNSTERKRATAYQLNGLGGFEFVASHAIFEQLTGRTAIAEDCRQIEILLVSGKRFSKQNVIVRIMQSRLNGPINLQQSPFDLERGQDRSRQGIGSVQQLLGNCLNGWVQFLGIGVLAQQPEGGDAQ